LAVCLAALLALAWAAAIYWLSPWLSTKTIDELDKLLDWALWLVIAGVVVEEGELFWKACTFFKLIISGLTREAFRKAWHYKGKLIESLGFIVLTVGLASELALQPSIEDRQKSAQTKASGDIATLRLEARTAEGKIADAQTGAAIAQADAARANERAAALEKQSAQLQRDNLTLQNQTAAAQEAAANARIEEARIRSAVVWRVMTPSECQAALSAVDDIPRTLVVRFSAGDPEAQLYAMSFGKCFEDSGRWKVSAASLVLASTFIFGLSMEGKDTAAVAAIRAALARSGLPIGEIKLDEDRVCSICGNSGRPENPDVLITVGSRPVTP
jgi:hypothetical protein